MFWPFAVFAVIVVVVWRLAQIPVRWILPRMLIEAPFLVLAVLLPFAEGGPRIEVVGLHLSVTGLYAAWGIVVKGTLGVAAALTVAATTSSSELPAALSRLGVPAVVTSVLVLMIRYVDVLAAEAEPDADGADLAWRFATRIASGRSDREGHRRAFPALLRTRGTGVSGDAVSRLRRKRARPGGDRCATAGSRRGNGRPR